jgi:hypothetical protein
LLVALLFTGLALIISGLGTMINTANPFFLALLIVLVTVIFTPLRDGLQRELDRLLFRKPVHLNELLREYGRELKTAVTTEQVQEILLKYTNAGLPEAKSQLFLPDNQTRCYSNGKDKFIDTDSPFIQAMRLHSGVLDLTGGGRLATLSGMAVNTS